MHVILMNKIEVIHKQKNIFGNINCSEYNGMYLLVTVFVSAAVNTLKQTENRKLKQVHKISRSMFEISRFTCVDDGCLNFLSDVLNTYTTV